MPVWPSRRSSLIPEDKNPMRGIMIGCALSLVIWAALYVLWTQFWGVLR